MQPLRSLSPSFHQHLEERYWLEGPGRCMDCGTPYAGEDTICRICFPDHPECGHCGRQLATDGLCPTCEESPDDEPEPLAQEKQDGC